MITARFLIPLLERVKKSNAYGRSAFNALLPLVEIAQQYYLRSLERIENNCMGSRKYNHMK